MSSPVNLSSPDELLVMAQGLGQHLDVLRDARRELMSTSAQLNRQAQTAVSACRAAVAQAEAALRAVSSEDDAALAAAQRALAEVQRRLDGAIREQRRLAEALDIADRTVSTVLRVAETRIEQGMNQLQQFWVQLGRTEATFAAALSRLGANSPGSTWVRGSDVSTAGDLVTQSTGVPAPEPPAGCTGGSPKPSSGGLVPVGSHGHVLVPLNDIDDSDSVVRDASSFGKVSLADMRAGLMRLQQTVIPAVRSGQGVAEMSARDALSGRSDDPASHQRVYEAFFGSTCIKLSRTEGGRFAVANGYHRIWVARQLGIDELPAMIRESS